MFKLPFAASVLRGVGTRYVARVENARREWVACDYVAQGDTSPNTVEIYPYEILLSGSPEE